MQNETNSFGGKYQGSVFNGLISYVGSSVKLNWDHTLLSSE